MSSEENARASGEAAHAAERLLATPPNGELARGLYTSNNLYLNLRSHWRVQKQLRFGFYITIVLLNPFMISTKQQPLIL